MGQWPLDAFPTWSLSLASAHTLLGMRCAHPDEFVPQVPSDANSVNRAAENGQWVANSQ